MYVVKYGNEYLHDPLSDNAILSDITLSSAVNTSGDCEFTMSPKHPLYNKIKLRSMSERVIVMQENTILFDGYIDSFDTNFDKTRDVKCYGCLSYLGDIRLRPYTTDRGEKDPAGMLYPPATVSGLYNFYIEEYNKYADDDKKFKIGINEGAQLLERDIMHAASNSFPRISDELSNNILNTVGGYLFVRHDGNDRYLDLFAECVDVNAQIVDFGVNMMDYVRNDNLSNFATAIRPSGTLIQDENDKNKDKDVDRNIDLTNYTDGPTAFPGFYKRGDVIYNKAAVEKYGYVEAYQTYSDVVNWDDLIARSVADLKPLSRVLPTIEIKAVDLALYQVGNRPLIPGQLVRIRSNPHGIDEYFLLNSMHINISNPSQTSYTFGIPIDTLTGEQSKRSLELNSKINHSLDAVDSLDAAVSDVAQTADTALSDASDAKDLAGSAATKAESAQSAADKAQSTADSNKNAIDTANTEIEAAKRGIAQAESEITTVNGRIDTMNDEIGAVNSSIDSANDRIDTINGQIETVSGSVDSLRTEVSTEVQNVKDSVDAVSSKADSAMDKASVLAGNLDATKAVVNKHSDKIGELTTSISNATTKADSALQVATEATQTANSFKTTATTAYENANEALTKSSTAVQKADEVSLNLSTNYQTKADSDALYATQASLKATSDSITSTVEKTYATKSSVETLQNIADSAIETWVGSEVPTGENEPASHWNTAELKRQHSGDIYYDSETGYSYRYGSTDGTVYSWTMIKDSDIQKAIQDAANAQLAAEGAKDSVDKLALDIPNIYATKSELTQTSDSIKATVSEASKTATSALNKATSVEQTANGLQATVTEQGTKLDETVTTVNKVSAKADSLTSQMSQVTDGLSSIAANGYNYIPNGAPSGDYNKPSWLTIVDGVYQYVLPGGQTHVDLGRQPLTRKLSSDRVYCISIECRLVSGSTTDSDYIMFGINNRSWSGVQHHPKSDWSRAENVIRNPSGNMDTWFISSYMASSGSKTIQFRNISIVDITNTSNANDKASSALTKYSELKQTIDGFKTTVSQTYETKADALNTQSTLNQTIDGFKANVSQTYETKADALNTQSTLNQTIDGFKTNVSQTYATKTSLNTLSNQADITYAMSVLNNTNNYWIRLGTATISEQGRITQLTLNVSKGNNGQPDQNAKAIIQIHRGWRGGDANHQFGVSVDNSNWKEIQVKAISGATDKVTIWVYNSAAGYMKGNYTVSGWRNSWEDQGLTQTSAPTGTEQQVTMNVSLDDVNDIATSALTKSSELEQTLDGFKTNVAQTYETKQDALNEQSTLNQKVDSLRSEVSETYATKTQLNNASSTTNMWPNQWFDTSKPCIGRAPVGNEIEAAPVGGNIRIIDGRDHYNGSVSSQVMPGRKYKVSVDAKKVSGTKSVISGGIWYTVQSSGTSWDGVGDFTKVKDYGNNWYRFERTVTVPNGKTMGAAWLLLNENNGSSNPAKWKISNLRFEDVTDIADIQANYSTKSYVDQTARTVSLGVVEEYKNGQHGSALATQSDISVAKDSITSTVSKTYTTKTDFNNLQISGGRNIARDTKAFGRNNVTDKDSGYLRICVNRTNGTYNGCTVRSLTSSDANLQTVFEYGVNNVDPGEYYTLSFWAKGSGTMRLYSYGPSGYIGARRVAASDGQAAAVLYNDGYTNMVLSSGWKRYWVVWHLNNNPPGGYNTTKYFLLRNDNKMSSCDVCGVMIEKGNKASEWAPAPEDIEKTYAAKSEVKQTVDGLIVTIGNLQSTANTANSNAANAQNRVGNLETCIKMTSEGVRVGKISNGSFTGYSALVNSAGSFDIDDASNKVIARFGPRGIDTLTGSLYVNGRPAVRNGAFDYYKEFYNLGVDWQLYIKHAGLGIAWLRICGTTRGNSLDQHGSIVIDTLPYTFESGQLLGEMHVSMTPVGVCNFPVGGNIIALNAGRYAGGKVSYDGAGILMCDI